jgi:hypothetical protein
MDDTLYGTGDKRCNWKPSRRLEYPQVFVWPLNFAAILRWIPEYLAPWNFLYAAIAIAFWLWLTPSMETRAISHPTGSPSSFCAICSW